MKVNKKAILGMLVAMVMSLGVMGGINGKSSDSNMQQIWYVSTKNASDTEYSLSYRIANQINASVSGGMASALIIGGLSSNPVGWAAIGAGVICLG